MKYKIVRMYRDDRPSKIMYTGFTLEQAQAHCQNPNTSGDGWFDGYEEETEITRLDVMGSYLDIASFYSRKRYRIIL